MANENLFALFICQGCKRQQRMLINGPKECQNCGGTFERLNHPLQATPDQVTIASGNKVIAYGGYGVVGEERHYSEDAIRREFAILMTEIEARLAAEAEMDKRAQMWYDKEKGGQDGEEEDDGDLV